MTTYTASTDFDLEPHPDSVMAPCPRDAAEEVARYLKACDYNGEEGGAVPGASITIKVWEDDPEAWEPPTEFAAEWNDDGGVTITDRHLAA